MSKDWFDWHDLYQTSPRLQQRLEIVRDYIATSLTAQPAGPIQVVSLCAGDGRDLLGALANHPRKDDVSARLVELNPRLVEQGRAAFSALRYSKEIAVEGLSHQIEFINGDATHASVYVGAVPADIVLVCGVFGNVADEAELQRLIDNLRALAKTGAFVVWTRGHSDGIAYSDVVRRQLQEAAFEEVSFRLTSTSDMGVGLHRYLGETQPLVPDRTLFVFSGNPLKAGLAEL